MPWGSFTLRVPEAAVRGLILGRRRSRDPAETAAGDRFNLTAMLLGVVADPPRLLALQRAMFAHAPDVLYEAPATSPDPNPNSTPNPTPNPNPNPNPDRQTDRQRNARLG